MDLETTIADAVERIAQLSERSFLARSPLHLARCGGCGSPSFQQPCPLCSYYPMGADKGTWHPAQASREFFCQKVAASAPAGTGNIATWVVGQARRSVAYKENIAFRRTADEALVQAAEMDVPEAGLVFDLVSNMEIPVHRERGPYDGWSFWEVVDTLRHSSGSGDRSTGIATALEDLHAGDFAGACSRLREVVEQAMLEDRHASQNLKRALATLDRIRPSEETAEIQAPRV